VIAPALYSSGSQRDHWGTPPWLVERLLRVGPIILDPCSNASSIVPAKYVFYESDDGLKFDWDSPEDSGVIYVNPPYSRVKQWVPIVAEEGVRLRKKRDTILLVAARTSENWFRPLWSADLFVFLHGRLSFLAPDPAQSKGAEPKKTNAPFPSVLACWSRRPSEIHSAFYDVGAVLETALPF